MAGNLENSDKTRPARMGEPGSNMTRLICCETTMTQTDDVAVEV